MTAVPPGPLSESVEPDPPAPASPTPSSTTQGPTPSGSGIDRLESKDKAADDSGQRPGAGTGTTATALAAATDLNSSGEAEYRAYLSLVRLRLLQALQYPRAAREQGLTGTVYLEIFVQPSGAISDVKIVSPSSHQILDRAALEAVRRLPAVGFPPGLAPRPLRARIPVVFDLRSR